MELEMYIKGKLVDHVRITKTQLEKISLVQDKLERKHHDDIEASRSLPKYFICGMPTSLIKKEKSARRK